jgi:hypothetical protein
MEQRNNIQWMYKFIDHLTHKSTSVPNVLVRASTDILFSSGRLLGSTLGTEKLKHELFII